MTSGSTGQGKRPAKKKGGGAGFLTLLIVVIIPASVFAAPTTLMFAVGLIPSFVAWIVDRDPEKSAGIIVGALNICGVLPFTMDMWRHSHTLPDALRMLGDPLTWLVMYGAAGVGWIFYYMVPPVVSGLEVVRAQARIDNLQSKKRALIEEWGPEVGLDDEALAQQQNKARPQGPTAASQPALGQVRA